MSNGVVPTTCITVLTSQLVCQFLIFTDDISLIQSCLVPHSIYMTHFLFWIHGVSPASWRFSGSNPDTYKCVSFKDKVLQYSDTNILHCSEKFRYLMSVSLMDRILWCTDSEILWWSKSKIQSSENFSWVFFHGSLMFYLDSSLFFFSSNADPNQDQIIFARYLFEHETPNL